MVRRVLLLVSCLLCPHKKMPLQDGPENKSFPVIRLPLTLHPRLFQHLEPIDILNLSDCSKTAKKWLLSSKTLPFQVQTRSFQSVLQISFLFADQMPVKLNFTVSPSSLDWMNCPLTIHEHRPGYGTTSQNNKQWTEKVVKWCKFLIDVFGVGLHLTTYDMYMESHGAYDIFCDLGNYVPKRSPCQPVLIQKLISLSDSHSTDFVNFWHQEYYYRLTSLNMYRPSSMEDKRATLTERERVGESKIERFQASSRWVDGGRLFVQDSGNFYIGISSCDDHTVQFARQFMRLPTTTRTVPAPAPQTVPTIRRTAFGDIRDLSDKDILLIGLSLILYSFYFTLALVGVGKLARNWPGISATTLRLTFFAANCLPALGLIPLALSYRESKHLVCFSLLSVSVVYLLFAVFFGFVLIF